MGLRGWRATRLWIAGSGGRIPRSRAELEDCSWNIARRGRGRENEAVIAPIDFFPGRGTFPVVTLFAVPAYSGALRHCDSKFWQTGKLANWQVVREQVQYVVVSPTGTERDSPSQSHFPQQWAGAALK